MPPFLLAWFQVSGAFDADANTISGAVADMTISDPKDAAATFDLAFSTTIELLDSYENKTLLMSHYDAETTYSPNYGKWYSLTVVENGNPIVHEKLTDEVLYLVYEVTITTNYDALAAADTNGTLTTLISESDETYTLSFASKAIEGTINHAASFWLQNTSTVTAPAAYEDFTVDVADISDSNKSWTKYLVVYVDGGVADHVDNVASVKAGVDATATVA